MAPMLLPTAVEQPYPVYSEIDGTEIAPSPATPETPAQGPVSNTNDTPLDAGTRLTDGQLNRVTADFASMWDNAATGYQTVWVDGTSSLSNVIIPTNSTAGWYTAKITYGNGGIYTTDVDNNLGPKRVEPRVKKKILLLDRPIMTVMKKPQLASLSDDNADAPISVEVDEIKHSRVIRQGRNRKYEFEVFEVPNDEGYIDTVYRRECLEGRGLRETGGGFFIFDPEVRSRFRFSKMVELKQAPSMISSRQRLQNRMLAPNEIIARDLLRRYVGDKEFKRYLKFGYVCMFAHGFTWRVPGENATISRVEQYERDKLVKRYCVHFADPSIPPTDACIMRMALISAGIDTISAHSNVDQISERRDRNLTSVYAKPTPQNRILTSLDAYREMKKVLSLN